MPRPAQRPFTVVNPDPTPRATVVTIPLSREQPRRALLARQGPAIDRLLRDGWRCSRCQRTDAPLLAPFFRAVLCSPCRRAIRDSGLARRRRRLERLQRAEPTPARKAELALLEEATDAAVRWIEPLQVAAQLAPPPPEAPPHSATELRCGNCHGALGVRAEWGAPSGTAIWTVCRPCGVWQRCAAAPAAVPAPPADKRAPGPLG